MFKHASGRKEREYEFHYEVVKDAETGTDKIEWHGLSFDNEMALSEEFEASVFLKDPLACLRLFLNKQKEYGKHVNRINRQ